MFSKIFFSVILLTSVYTYMLKSIQDNNDINFRKLPDNFNSELNEIQTVKPNLKVFDLGIFKAFLDLLLGDGVLEAIEKHKIKHED